MNLNNDKFIITPKEEKSVTFTIRLETDLNNYIEEIARISGRARNAQIEIAFPCRGRLFYLYLKCSHYYSIMFEEIKYFSVFESIINLKRSKHLCQRAL